MNILVTICARGGSKGIPGKNIKQLNGIPLIGYTINTAKDFCNKYGADMALSTDDEEIKIIANQFGLQSSYTRPSEFATDDAGKIAVIKDLLLYEERTRLKSYDAIVDLDVTSPLRTLNDIDLALEQFMSVPKALNLFSVSIAGRNPYFNMVELRNDGFVGVVKNGGIIKSRQKAPVVYDMNGSFYIYRKKFFEQEWEVSITNASLAYVMPHMCFDLDNPVDFTIMEIMLQKKLLDFEL